MLLKLSCFKTPSSTNRTTTSHAANTTLSQPCPTPVSCSVTHADILKNQREVMVKSSSTNTAIQRHP